MKTNPQGLAGEVVLQALEGIPCTDSQGPSGGVGLKADHGEGLESA